MENQLEISIWRDTQSWAAEGGGTGAWCPLTFVKIKKMCPFFIKNGPFGNFDTAVIYTCSHVKYIIIRAQIIQNCKTHCPQHLFKLWGGGVKGIKYTSFSLLREVPFFGGASAAYAPRHNHIQTYADYHAGLSTNMKAAGRNIFQAGKPSSRPHI